MAFNSFHFGLFFSAIYLACLFLPHRSQNRFLLSASWLFYASWNPGFLALILITTALDYRAARAMEDGGPSSPKKKWLVLSLAGNLGILGFFKYFNFFTFNVSALAGIAGFPVHPLVLKMALPVGISFYTFQSLGYVLDVYRGKIKPEKNFWDYALFVSFFPLLLAGPIERASNLLAQIKIPRLISGAGFSEGARAVLWGLFKKIVVADRLAVYVNAVFENTGGHSGATLWAAACLFVFQLYADFSAYSDIARGIAKMLGFHGVRNFNLPLFAVNIQDFWNRWHISLSTWFRDYVFTPLFLKLSGLPSLARLCVSILLTMTVIGLWHGPAWHYVAFGFFEGLLLAGYALARPWLKGVNPRTEPLRKLWIAFRVLCMFQLTAFGLMLFRVNNLGEAGIVLKKIVSSPWPFFWAGDFREQLLYGLAGIAVLLLMENPARVKPSAEVLDAGSPVLRWTFYIAALLGISLFGVYDGGSFIYFRF